MAFLLFGDQSLDTHGFLADFYRQGNPSVLSKEFLQRAGDALRVEVESLPRTRRERIPIFKSLQQLNEKYHGQSNKYPGVDSALLCIAQLAHYIEYAYFSYSNIHCLRGAANKKLAGPKRNTRIAQRRRTQSSPDYALVSSQRRRSRLARLCRPYFPSPSKLS